MRVGEDHELVVPGRRAGELIAGGPRVLRPTTGSQRDLSGLPVAVRDGQGIADIAAMLQAAGLMILSIRQVTQREAWGCTSLSGPGV